ncbi:MAG: hypothetical protein HY735_15255 [Verrucomicrobia bacterium]|nr:hypothetical protein [Verrucomicrobiota bacterium]
MSYNVLVIPEDFTKDEHILKPLVERILDDGERKAHVLVCRDPNFQGVDAALDLNTLRSMVIDRYPMVDLFILLVDRDGKAGREHSADRIEKTLSGEMKPKTRRFLAELARQEVEVFVLAGHDLPADWSWKDIRMDADVKNTFFKRFVALRGTSKQPHEGRKKLMGEAIANWQRIKSRCPEDVGALLTRISQRL